MYRIELSQSARKQLSKLPSIVQHRVFSVLERIKVRPYTYVEKVIGTPFYRLRVGDYRIIMNIQDEILFILVVEIEHRKNVYDKL